MTDELRDQIAKAAEDYDDWDDHIDRIVAVVEPKLSEAMAEAEQLRGEVETVRHVARRNAEAHRLAYLESAKQRDRAEWTESRLAHIRDALEAWEAARSSQPSVVHADLVGPAGVKLLLDMSTLITAIQAATNRAALSPAGGSEDGASK